MDDGSGGYEWAILLPGLGCRALWLAGSMASGEGGGVLAVRKMLAHDVYQ